MKSNYTCYQELIWEMLGVANESGLQKAFELKVTEKGITVNEILEIASTEDEQLTYQDVVNDFMYFINGRTNKTS